MLLTAPKFESVLTDFISFLYCGFQGSTLTYLSFPCFYSCCGRLRIGSIITPIYPVRYRKRLLREHSINNLNVSKFETRSRMYQLGKILNVFRLLFFKRHVDKQPDSNFFSAKIHLSFFLTVRHDIEVHALFFFYCSCCCFIVTQKLLKLQKCFV